MKNVQNLFVLICLLITAQVSAQFSVGVKGGYTKAWEEYGDVGLPDDAEIDVSGFNISSLAYYKINNHLQVGIEPGFVQRGAACIPGWNVGPDPIFNADTKILLNYVEAPIMVAGNLGFFQNKLELFGKIGYGATYLSSGYSEQIQQLTGVDDPVLRAPLDLSDSSNMNRWDHGAYAGMGLGYNLGRHQVFIESDFYMAMKDAERFNTSKNRSVDFSIGYLIRL